MTKDEALNACKEALEQPAQEPVYQVGEIVNPYESNIKIKQSAQEPVAWLYKRENSSGGWYVVTNYEKEHDNGTRNIQCYDIPLYTHPTPSWQGLSDNELSELFAKCGWVEEGDNLRELGFYKHARMIQQALKEKNYE